MTATAPFPDFFLHAPGEPAAPFKVWEQIFNNYCLVIDVDGLKWTEARQRAPLLHCLGTEGQCTGMPPIKVCNKKGHFAHMCRSAAQTHSVRQVEIPEYTLLLLQ